MKGNVKKLVAVMVAMVMAVAAMAMEWKSSPMVKYYNPAFPAGQSIESFQWKTGDDILEHLVEEKIIVGYEVPELEESVGYGIAPQGRCGNMKAKDIDKLWNLDKSVDGDRAEVLVINNEELVIVFYTVKKGKVKEAKVWSLVELFIYN